MFFSCIVVSQCRPFCHPFLFVAIDLKDAYFHVQIVKRHKKFLRFALEGKAYQYHSDCLWLLECSQSVWMQFWPCYSYRGIRILNYLDDWLILAQSQDLATAHRDLVLDHLRSLGLWANPQKSVLLPCQQMTFLGVD